MAKLSAEDRALVYRKGRTIYFFDDIEASSVCEAIKLIQDITIESPKSKQPIEFIINSEGGNCYDGLALYDALRQSDYEIVTIGTGIVASMALIIFLAGDQRLVTENTRLMNHQMSTGVEGKVTDVGIDYNEAKALDEVMNEIISERTGITLHKLKKEIRIGDRWFTAEQAADEGYADEVIQNKHPRRRRKKK